MDYKVSVSYMVYHTIQVKASSREDAKLAVEKAVNNINGCISILDISEPEEITDEQG